MFCLLKRKGNPRLCRGVSKSYTSKQVAAELLGHAGTSFLERTYCHPQLESKQRAASVLAEWIQPAEDEAWEREQKQMNTESAG